jgi:hypothetical protein
MPDQIMALFCNPPIAVARLGGSPTPLDAYHWRSPLNPRSDGETVIFPAWSLELQSDGTVEPFMPPDLRLRDGELIRPVSPFIEIWARVGEPGAAESGWRSVPLTPSLLAAAGASVADLVFSVTARNLKAARRTQNPDLEFGTFPALEIRADDHLPKPVLGVSPPGAATPMIPPGRSIPLGTVQVIRSRAQPTSGSVDWSEFVNVETIRLRYTPAAGRFYGPPEAAGTAEPDPPIPAVAQADAFLDPAAGWYRQPVPLYQFVQPGDTVDLARNGEEPASLGVVDDTCEVRIDARLSLGGRVLETHANLFVAPPDFAPDRRPFLSIADEINDRSGDSEDRNAAMDLEDLNEWVADLFERAYEHVSLMNVDHWRRRRGVAPLAPNKLLAVPIPGDGLDRPTQAMGSRDALRNQTLRVGEATSGDPLPLSNHARERHRTLSDVDFLRKFVLENPDRLGLLIRGPFEVETGESAGATSMRMPPFMRQSNAQPLTLAAWQYALVQRWVAETLAAGGPAILAPTFAARADAVADAADRYREEVLSRLEAEESNP